MSRSPLTFHRRGDGPPVVLLHGWCLDRTVWMYQEHAIVQGGYEVIAPDLAGYGGSRGLTAPRTLAEHAEHVADLLDDLRLDAAVVAGFAFGAAVAVALPRFDRVGGIVSIGIPSAAGAPYDRMKRSMLRDWPAFAARSAPAILAREHSDASVDWLARIYAATPLDSALAGADILASFEPLEQGAPLPVPSLFVHGADDTIVAPTVSEQSADRFGGSFELIPDSGHFVPWDQPEPLSTAMLRFVGGVE